MWDSIICPIIFSLIKQIDRIVAETTSGADSYLEQACNLVSALMTKVPDKLQCYSTLVKKWALVSANLLLKLAMFENASKQIETACRYI